MAKQINSLIQYLRREKGIIIKGANQKRKLRNIGYYHGYKGYRFYRTQDRQIPYRSFNELTTVYDYDMQLKTLFYPEIMFLETAIKNYVLEQSLKLCDSDRFDDFYDVLLTRHLEYKTNSGEQKALLSKRSRLRSRIFRNLKSDYSNKPVVRHFMSKGKQLPIWAIFEIIGLSDLGNLLMCAKTSLCQEISKSIGFNPLIDTEGELPEATVYAIKDLRNAVAHNDSVFDVRFQEFKIDDKLSSYLEQELNIKTVDFQKIVDYFILTGYLLSCFGQNKHEIRRYFNSFLRYTAVLKNKVQPEIFEIIAGSDCLEKAEKFYKHLFKGTNKFLQK